MRVAWVSSLNNSVCAELKLPYCNLATIKIQPIIYGNSLFDLIILKQLPTDEIDNVRGKLTELKFSKHTFRTLICLINNTGMLT